MWLIILGLTMLGALAGLIYLTIALSRFAWLKKLTGKNKVLGTAASLAIIVAVFVIIDLATTFMNAVVVLLHVMLFFLLSAAVVLIYKRISRREPKFYLQGWLALSAVPCGRVLSLRARVADELHPHHLEKHLSPACRDVCRLAPGNHFRRGRA